MLDEILKGTNTRDRHKGSAALIRKLVTKNAMGFVSTHDLELGDLATGETNIRNYSFNSEIKENEIIFDYKISPGICHSFNASMLMKKIGILDNEN
jgi:DNA mismatch repair ATPase MutS